ncbi:MAG: dienelactone hydrolase family protein [Caulobacteraceae bacterium]
MIQSLIDCAEILLPEGAGPFPVVVQMHACGGLHAVQKRYAQAAVEAGTAVVILDSFRPRDIRDGEALLTVCTGLRLRGGERAEDLRSVLDWLHRQPWADADRIAAAGWSHGAWSVMEALAADDGHAGVAALKLAVLVYPYAGPLARTARHGWGRNRPAVLACLAGRDLVVGRLAPRRAISRLQSDGLGVELLEFEDAGHCFDEDMAHPPGVAYRPDLEALLRERYALALRRALIDPYSPGASAWAANCA